MSYPLKLSLCVALLPFVNAPPIVRAEEEGHKVYRQTLRSTVLVLTQGDNPRDKRSGSQGTGALISLDDRLVLTNWHVVGEHRNAWVVFPLIENGKVTVERQRYIEELRKQPALAYPGRVVFADAKIDVVLIQLDRLPEGAVALKLAKESARPGERVHSVGNPGVSDALWLYTSGTVRQVYQKKWEVRENGRVHPHEARVLETQSPTNQGDSGGPLVNDQGELVGVTQGHTMQAQLLSLFIDVSEVRNVLAGKGYRYFVADRRPAAAPADSPPATTSEKKSEDLALLKLRQGLNHMQAGRNADARDAFKEIIDKHADSPYVNEAKALFEAVKRK